jgi:hypothetical protein
MTAPLLSHWRLTLAVSLIAGGAVAGVLNRADEPAAPAARPPTCEDVAPCLRAWSADAARTGPGDRVRRVVAMIMGCRWEPCERS